jgi:hypothetical protein
MSLNSDQFVDVFHSSYLERPPHEVSVEEIVGNKRYASMDKSQENAVFAGTRAAAESRFSRNYIHKYRIPRSMVRPELWADDLSSPRGRAPLRPTHHHSDTQAQLFEQFPADPADVTPTEVIQYRNDVEDMGSISHIMHKDAIKNGTIQYLGTEPMKKKVK